MDEHQQEIAKILSQQEYQNQEELLKQQYFSQH